MRFRTLLAFVLLSWVPSSLACRRSAPIPEAIQSDPEKTKDAAIDASKSKSIGPWTRLGSFSLPQYCELDAIVDGQYRLQKIGPDVDGMGPLTGIRFVDASGKILRSRDALDDMLAMSPDGRIQFTAATTGTTRVDVDTKVKTPWKKPGFPDSVSEDGKLVVTTDIEVYELATEKLVCKVPVPFAGGAEGVYRFAGGSRWLTMGNGRGSYFIDPTACKLPPIGIGSRFVISTDGNVIVEIPHDQFAIGWSEDFIVVDPATGNEVRKLALKLPDTEGNPADDGGRWDAAVTPTGDLVIVGFARELIVLRTADGKELHREGIADLVAKDANVVVAASSTELAVSSAGKVTRFSLP